MNESTWEFRVPNLGRISLFSNEHPRRNVHRTNVHARKNRINRGCTANMRPICTSTTTALRDVLVHLPKMCSPITLGLCSFLPVYCTLCKGARPAGDHAFSRRLRHFKSRVSVERSCHRETSFHVGTKLTSSCSDLSMTVYQESGREERAQRKNS